MSEIKQRLIDGDKLLEWVVGNGKIDLLTGGFVTRMYNEINSGSYDIPSGQGEAARLRDYVLAASNYRRGISEAIAIWESMDSFDDPVNVIEQVITTLKETLSSSHTEDIGIQRVRQVWQHHYKHGNTFACLAVESVLEAFGITIPGITEER